MFFVLVVVFLCCYVVKLGIAKKTETKKKHPQKSGSTSGYFLQDKLWLHVPKLLLFFLAVLLFFLVAQKHYKNRFFDDFEMLIFSFFGQKSRVNNLATVGSITWPHFFAKFWKNVAKLLTLQFSHVFLLKLVFFKNLILPAERRRFLNKKKKQ